MAEIAEWEDEKIEYIYERVLDNSKAVKKLMTKIVEQGPSSGNANLVIFRISKPSGLRLEVFPYSVRLSGYAKGGQKEDAS